VNTAHNGANLGLITAIVAVATLGGFLFGFDSGVINGTVDGLRIAFDSDDVGTGFNVASMLLGCAVGAFVAGRLSDLLGRKKTLMIAAAFFIVSAYGSGIAGSSTEFVIYRIIGGFAVGAASVLAPAYISEVTPASMRGRLSSIQQVMIIVGLTAAFLSNYLLAEFAGASTAEFWLGFEAWRWMFWIELVPATIFLVALFFIPESPRYLVTRGRQDDARSVLDRLFGGGVAARKVGEIERSVSNDHTPRLSDLIDRASGRVRTIVWVGIGLATFQQLVGINVVF
jgi:SP family sugar:H+ symporter-like MFS transporter